MYYDRDEVATGDCYGCGAVSVSLHQTLDGLRCSSCVRDGTYDGAGATYTPSLRPKIGPEPLPPEVMRMKAAKSELENLYIEMGLIDGSTYTFDGFDAGAVLYVAGDDYTDFLVEIARDIADHYERQTEPTRRTTHASWGRATHDQSKEEYETHAELAPVVAHSYLQNAKMQLLFSAMAGEDNSVKVVGVGSDSITEYTEHGPIQVEAPQKGDSE